MMSLPDQSADPIRSHSSQRMTTDHTVEPDSPIRAKSFDKIEIVIWIMLALLALVTRLADLGTRPLSDAEATQALVSWQLYQGKEVSYSHYSPLLATVNFITFALWGATEFTARVTPAVSGALLVILPLGLRRYVGRVGAISAGVLLCISPAALHLSRTVNGDVVATVGTALVLLGLVRMEGEVASRQGIGAVMAAAGLALMVISSPLAGSGLGLLLMFVVALSLASRGKRVVWLSEVITCLRTALLTRRRTLVMILILAAAAASGLFLNLNGLATTVDQIGEWARGFMPPEAGGVRLATPPVIDPVYPSLWLLGLYEPLTLLSALFGLGIALTRRRFFHIFLAWWFCSGVLLDALRPSRSPGEVLLTLWPAALLAGLAIGQLAGTAQSREDWKRDKTVVLTGLTVAAFAYVTLMIYTSGYGVVWQPLAAIGMFVALVVVYWQWYDKISALRGAAFTIIAVLFLFQIASAVRLNYVPVADASQPLVRTSAGEGMRDLVAVLQFVSTKKANDPYLVDLLASRAVGAAVEWQLRSFPNVRWVNSLERLPMEYEQPGSSFHLPDVILAPEDTLLTDEPYAGQDFIVHNYWQPTSMPFRAFIRWYLLREMQPTFSNKVVLWVKQPPAASTLEK